MANNHPTRNWRKAWTVSQSELSATHSSGLRIFGKKISNGLDVEIDNATMPALIGLTPAEIQAVGRELGRRCEEGGRLLLEVINVQKDN